MSIDATIEEAHVGDADTRHVEVLIVGAGPAGALSATFLAQSGFDVLCLEQGDWTDSRDYPGNKLECELLERKPWNANPNLRGREADYPIDASEADFTPNMFAGVGGSSILFRAHWVRMLPSDFRVRSLDGVGDDWPFTYDDLLPYYEAMDDYVGTAGLGGDPAYPPGSPPPLPPHPLLPMQRRVANAMNELGWHWWPAPNAIASRRHRRLNPCLRYGTCISGCPNESKASFDLVMWPDALAHGARLQTGARVSSIMLSPAGLATGVSYIDRDGKAHVQTADVVILAANSVGNARLLLLSKSGLFPDGLANSSGLVGKRLMTHPFAGVIGMFDEEYPSWKGPFGQSIQSLEFYETDSTHDFARGAKWGLLPTGGPLGHALNSLLEDHEDGPHADVRERLGHSLQWGILAEDLPDESNRVELHESVTDSDDVPAPKIIARDDVSVGRNLDFQVARATESLEAAGAHKVVRVAAKATRSHNIGTTVMGSDPSRSVVDEFGRCHDVPNLYIVGASTFPTGGAVNPTATLCAVTLRAIEHLVANRAEQRVPV